MARLRNLRLNSLLLVFVPAALYLLVVSAHADWPPTSKGDWKNNPANGHWYRLTAPMTWLQAEAKAVEWGGHLATIRNRQEELWLRFSFGPYEYFWIGFNDRSVEGQWKWVSGEPVTYTNWWPGQPDNYGDGEDAAGMNFGGGEWCDNQFHLTYGDGWNDSQENTVLRGIVEVGRPHI
jgi:hypothetical protein